MSGVNEVTWAEFVAVCCDLHDLKRDLAIAEDALEAERQWRLTSLPPLLAAEERAVKAEAEVASFRNVTEYREVPIVSGGGPNLPRQFPELRPPRIPSAAAVRAAFHQSTNEERP